MKEKLDSDDDRRRAGRRLGAAVSCSPVEEEHATQRRRSGGEGPAMCSKTRTRMSNSVEQTPFAVPAAGQPSSTQFRLLIVVAAVKC